MVRLVPRAFAATVALLAAGFSPATASADPVLVFPGMEIYKVIGHLRAFRDNTPSGSTVATHELIADYEAIVLADDVTASNILPSGRALESRPGVVLHPGQAVCHFGVSTGETCGTVESVNNGWFTMSHGVLSEKGDSGGPVYLAPDGGPAQIVGIFNSVWGGFPAAVSWRSTSEQVHADLGVTPLA